MPFTNPLPEQLPTPPLPPAGPLGSHGAFMAFWGARLAGTMATQMLMVALGWQMYELTGRAWDLGLVGLCQFVPSLLLALPAGHLIDRHHRGRILAGCMAVQAAVAVLLAILVSTATAAGAGYALALSPPSDGASSAGLSLAGFGSGRTWLLAVSVLLGAVRAFQMPAQQALVPLLVPAALLPRALAFSSAGMQVAIIGGPALGGLVYAAGAPVVYALCAVLFGVAGALLLLRVRYQHVAPPNEPVTLGTLLAGVAFIRSRPAVLGAISLDLFAVLLGGATALLPMFAKDVLHAGPSALGLLRAAPAAGALMTAVVLARWPISRRVGHVMFAAVALYGVATLLFGLSTHFVLSWLLLWLTGAADMVSVVIRQSLVQLDTPDAMRGRVSAVNSIFIGASNQLGEFESGASAALLGPVGSVVMGGVGTVLVAGLWAHWFPSLAQRENLTSDEAASGETPAVQ